MIRLKVDENLPSEVAKLLNQLGYDALTVYEQKLQGVMDSELISICKTESRVLITLDLDFASIRSYPPEEYSGIIVLKLKNQAKKNVLNSINKILPLMNREPLPGRLWIVDETNVRIHETGQAS